MKTLISQVGYSIKATLCLSWILLSSIISANILEPTAAAALIDESGSDTVFVVENSGAGQVIYTADAGASGSLTYSLSVNSALHSQTRAIEQRFIDNADGSMRLQLLIDTSVADNYPGGIDNLDLILSYNPVEIEYITADQISTPSNPFAAFFNTEDSAGDILVAQVYFPKAFSLAGETPVLEVDFNLEPGVTSAQFEISGVRLNNDDLTDTVSRSRYLGDDGLGIDVVSGAVTLFTNPNYKSQPLYSFSVTATDEASISNKQAVIATVVDSTDQAVYATTWDFDGNGEADALTDGLILLRYAFGLRDASLTDYLVDQNATLTAAEVEETINKALAVADIDGDGQVAALTDGLLLLRYLFGFQGEVLIKDAVSTNGSRTSAEEIMQHLDKYMPNT